MVNVGDNSDIADALVHTAGVWNVEKEAQRAARAQ
jgi:hypothetical protein